MLLASRVVRQRPLGEAGPTVRAQPRRLDVEEQEGRNPDEAAFPSHRKRDGSSGGTVGKYELSIYGCCGSGAPIASSQWVSC